MSTRASTRRSDPWPLPVRLERTWVPDPLAYPRPPHTERFPYPYHPTIPPAIADAELLLSGTVAKAVEDASRLLERLNTSADALHYELVAAPLLRSEAVSSSRIEGLRASHRTIAEALEGPGAAKATALAIANNVGAMQDAITMAEAGPLEVSTILDIHRRLVAHTQHEPLGGVTRQAQNWIGPSNHGPYGAIYVPPPPGEVDRLLADLVQFAARGDLPAMAQAAIVHAQFEAIHPFADGNGRVGRVLIHVVFRRRGLSPHVVPPLSTVLAARQSEYFAALAAFQQQGDVARWITHFATATAMAADSAQHLGAQIAELVTDWTVRIGPRRAGAVAPELLPLLVQRPIVSAATAAKSVGVTDTAMRRVLGQLEQSGIVRQITIGRRNRVWAADEVFDLLDRFEHDVASSGDGGLPSPTRHLRNE